MEIQPFIVGSGMAGKAMARSLAILDLLHPGLELRPPRQLGRDEPLAGLADGSALPVLFIANPHAFHARYLLEGEKAGFRHIVCDKPACVSREEARRLEDLRAAVAICHGYRQTWGPQTIRRLIDSGELGEVFAIEGRYWQSSAAQRALVPDRKPNWKNDARLSGPADVLFDLASHWVDLVFFLMGGPATAARGWKSYANAEAPHRDTHLQLWMSFPGDRRSLGSISKTFHGASNVLQVHVLGTRGTAYWEFERMDEIVIGRGNQKTVLQREESALGSRQPPFHSLGWLEGYVEIIHRALLRARGEAAAAAGYPIPDLGDHLQVLETLFGLRDFAA